MQDITKLKSPHERKVYATQTSDLSHLVVTIRYSLIGSYCIREKFLLDARST